ncbi:ESPR-type extended signal peptide-containing protein [Megasphaera paucivorans]|uniref:Extended Signal Peptide of Type V secretion system n=1 Tax=Megasphaera paucivorans TaxID=349095 RepID=A0A1H0A540_9FIRM|nr:ESPR-type extended signal peptide-containing protein [Megasphaera paucivorans]SDN28567.1 Extended Signal Peptide of Type V secretion system [Megasphaera paucivorans]
MNKIFNVVWSKTKNCWIVVSEFVATGGGKGKKVRRKKSGVVTASMAAMFMLFNAGIINAAFPPGPFFPLPS